MVTLRGIPNVPVEGADRIEGWTVHIKAGERHGHGAKADTTMGHITITAVGGEAKWG